MISSVLMLVYVLEKECLILIPDINHKIDQRYILFREILKKNFSKVGRQGWLFFPQRSGGDTLLSRNTDINT